MSKVKRSFVLLEVMIALALASISILPFLRYPYAHMKQEMELLFQMELERLAQAEFAICYVDLPKMGETLLSSKARSILYKKETVEVRLGETGKRQYTKQVGLTRGRVKKKVGGGAVALIGIEVEFLPHQAKGKGKKGYKGKMEMFMETSGEISPS